MQRTTGRFNKQRVAVEQNVRLRRHARRALAEDSARVDRVFSGRRFRLAGACTPALGCRIATHLVSGDFVRISFDCRISLKKRFAIALSRRVGSTISSSKPYALMARHNSRGSPRNVIYISSRCHVTHGLR